MKKKDVLLIALLLLAALSAALVLRMEKPPRKPELVITVDGKEYGRYALEQDQRIKIFDTNICEIKDGRVRMCEADCPDGLCIRQKSIGAEGGTIICLPNRVFLEVAEAKQESDKPDTIVS